MSNIAYIELVAAEFEHEEALLELFLRFTPKIERQEVGQYFLDFVSLTEALMAMCVISRQLPKFGLKPLIVTLAQSRLMAKALAAGMLSNNFLLQREAKRYNAKTLTIYYLEPEQEQCLWPRLPIQFLWPVAPKVRSRLLELGVKNLTELQTIPRDFLIREFGPIGSFLVFLREGNFTAKVTGTPTLAAFSAGIHQPDLAWTPELAYRSGLDLLSSLSVQLADAWAGCTELIVILHFQENSLVQMRKFTKPTHSYNDLKVHYTQVWQEFIRKQTKWAGRDIWGINIQMNGIKSVEMEQLTIFAGKAQETVEVTPESRRLERVLVNLQKKYGQQKVVAGRQLPISRREQCLAHWDPWRFAN